MVEALVSLLIVSAVGMAAMNFASSYLKTTYERDLQINALADNMNTAETLRAGVKTLPHGKNMKITAVGIGEIDLTPDGSFTVISPEGFGFSDNIKPKQARLFKIDIGGDDIPNSKITTVVNLE